MRSCHASPNGRNKTTTYIKIAFMKNSDLDISVLKNIFASFQRVLLFIGLQEENVNLISDTFR